jgi:hypothetical protein
LDIILEKTIVTAYILEAGIQSLLIILEIQEADTIRLLINGGLSGGSRPARRVYDSPSKGILWGWEVTGYILTKALASGILGIPLLLNQLGWVYFSSESFWITSLVSLFFLAATGMLLIRIWTSLHASSMSYCVLIGNRGWFEEVTPSPYMVVW